MRHRLRSVPLCQIECPQWNWVLRNNSRPREVPQNTIYKQNISQNAAKPAHDNTMENDVTTLVPNKHCYCANVVGLKPTLFPHPVTCAVTSNNSYLSEEKYRHCRIHMDDTTIGEMMKEAIIENLPPAPLPPSFKAENIKKKIFRSAKDPKNDEIHYENPCMKYRFDEKPPAFLRTINNQYDTDQLVRPKTHPCGTPCLTQKSNYMSSPMKEDEIRCKWREEGNVCLCKKNHNIDNYRKNEIHQGSLQNKFECSTNYQECICENLPDKKESLPPILHPLVEIPHENSHNINKDIFLPVDEQENIAQKEVCSPRITNVGVALVPNLFPEKITNKKSTKKKHNKSSRKGKSPTRKEKLPWDVVCDRVEVSHANPFRCYLERHASKYQVKRKKLELQEIFHNQKLERRSKTSSKSSIGNINETQKINSILSLKKQRPQQRLRPPWNFNNQPKFRDPMKRGNRLCWNKVRFSKNSKEIAVITEDEPSLRESSPHSRIEIKENEEHSKAEEKRMRKKLQMSKVKNWTQASMVNAFSADENHKIYDTEMIEDSKQVDRNNNIECLQSLKNATHRTTSDSAGTMPHTQSEDIKKKKHERNLKLKQTKTVILKRHIDEDSDNKLENNVSFDKSLATDVNMLGQTRSNLSDITEENDDNDNISQKPSEYRRLNETYRKTEYGHSNNTKIGLLRSRPEDYADNNEVILETKEAIDKEKPYFNVIKTKIHSRSKTLGKFIPEHFPKTQFSKPNSNTLEDHSCLHRFTVDDRLFPLPLHSDAFGNSCCIHCDKPMKTEERVFLNRKKLDEKEIAHNQNSSFKPKSVHIGDGKSLMEIRLKPVQEQMLNQEKMERSKRNNNYHSDSLALRHQRRWM